MFDSDEVQQNSRKQSLQITQHLSIKKINGQTFKLWAGIREARLKGLENVSLNWGKTKDKAVSGEWRRTWWFVSCRQERLAQRLLRILKDVTPIGFQSKGRHLWIPRKSLSTGQEERSFASRQDSLGCWSESRSWKGQTVELIISFLVKNKEIYRLIFWLQWIFEDYESSKVFLEIVSLKSVQPAHPWGKWTDSWSGTALEESGCKSRKKQGLLNKLGRQQWPSWPSWWLGWALFWTVSLWRKGLEFYSLGKSKSQSSYNSV